MSFVYAAFFEDRSDVFIKFGRSWQPYKRVKEVAQSSPFVLSQAVFASASSGSNALRIERSLGQLLRNYRTRGEWYRFPAEEGLVFSSTIRTVYAKMVGKRLAWTVIDHEAILAEMSVHSAKFVRPKRDFEERLAA